MAEPIRIASCWLVLAASIALVPRGGAGAAEAPDRAESAGGTSATQNGSGSGDGEAYRTPRAGEAYEARIFGREIEVPARDLRRVFAIDLGMSANVPPTNGIPAVPFGALFAFWRPDDDRYAEATISGIRNDVLAAWSLRGWGPFEVVVKADTATIPAARSEFVDGRSIDAIEIVYGDFHIGGGLGYRRQLEGTPENMWAVTLTLEPGMLYFDRGEETAAAFELPPNSFELLTRARLRYDGFQRNLLSLIHGGLGAGVEGLFGYRASWRDWGIDGVQDGSEAGRWGMVRGYAQGATGVPFVPSERHRLVGSFHFGAGFDVDRFSATRIGGGPEIDQYRSVSRPVMPGAAIGEFYPEHYAIWLAEYRYEVVFFSYVGVRASASYVGANADTTNTSTRRDPWGGSVGGRWTTGMAFETRMRFDYNYNFGVVRPGRKGAHEFVFDISREF